MSRIKWSKERVIEEIHRIYGKLPSRHPARRRLYETAQQYFGSWDEALAAAGVPRKNQTWSKAKIIQWIQKEYSQQGAAIWDDCSFRTAVFRRFGTRSAALGAAGFSPVRLKWTPEMIIDRLRTHAKFHKIFVGLAQQDDRLYQAAKRHFGSWPQAIEAAGFPARRRWTRAAIIEAIQHRERENLPLWKVSQRDPPLYWAAKRHFGGWRKALAAAGCEVKFPKKWTRDSVCQSLRELRDRPGSFTMSQRATLRCASLRYFASWAAALASVGIRSQPRQAWTADRVLWETRAWHHQTGGDRKQLASAHRQAMLRYFGGVRKAIEAAGIPRKSGSSWSKSVVIEKIQDSYIRGRPVQRPSDVEKSLARAAKNRFGSWKRALIAAGLESESLKRQSCLTPEGLIGMIQARSQQGHSMLGEDNRDLMTAVRKFFGGWVNAQLAAGLEPRHERWTRERLVQAIRNRLQQGPILLDDRLRSAALRHFGSWQNALRAAGLEKKDTPCRVKT
jgi:hypothetical protein